MQINFLCGVAVLAVCLGTALGEELIVVLHANASHPQAVQVLADACAEQGWSLDPLMPSIYAFLLGNLPVAREAQVLLQKHFTDVVEIVEENVRVRVARPSPTVSTSELRQQQEEPTATQTNAPWALDRIDQRDSKLDGKFVYPSGERNFNAHIYILDTGVDARNVEFRNESDGCQTRVLAGYSVLESGGDGTSDDNGHGTFVAALAAGKTYGVAKSVAIVPVQVLDRQGEGSLADILRGLEWVLGDIRDQLHVESSVINMSLGAPFSRSMNRAVNRAVDDGYVIVVAAGNFKGKIQGHIPMCVELDHTDGLGNERADACQVSPASSDAITVGSSDRNDRCSSFTNYGSCVDLFAPGDEVLSASLKVRQEDSQDCNGFLYATYPKQDSGTSFSSPLVAGVLATYIATGRVPEGSEPFSERMKRKLVEESTMDVLGRCGGLFRRSPNRLLYVQQP